MRKYYSGSSFVKFLRKKVFKFDKPTALGWGEWEKWDANLKATRPIANFFTETAPDFMSKTMELITKPYDETRYFISNLRAGSHCLRSKLKKGKYHEFSKRMIHSNFDSFVNFIEVELAYHSMAWADKDNRKKYYIPLYRRFLNWDFNKYSAQAGVDHLKWEITLNTPPDPPDPNWQSSEQQASNAFEKLTLYTWWKVIRPKREEEGLETDFDRFWFKMDEKYKDHDWIGIGARSKLTVEERAEYDLLSKQSDEREAANEIEDDEMLIRLIKLRDSLWT